MDRDDIVKVATECQTIARGLAHSQNVKETILKSHEVQRVVCACLNAGNLLEAVARTMTPTEVPSDVPSSV